ncbi:MAG: carbohydrate binding domain-containing protein [Elusimicrobiota bacterium]
MFNKCILIILFMAVISVPAYSADIDNMDSIGGWSTDGDGTIEIQSIVGYSNNSLKCIYDITGKGYVQFSKSSYGSPDFTGGDALALTYRGLGDSYKDANGNDAVYNNNIELKMYDSDGDIFAAVIDKATHAGNSWTTLVIPQSSFNLWLNSSDEPYGNGTKNWNSIVKYSIGITKNTGGSGYVEIDSLNAYQQNPPGTYTIDSCDTGTNSLGNATWSGYEPLHPNNVTMTVENTSPSPAGGKYYKIDYTKSDGGWVVGLEEDMTVVDGVLRSSFNATAYSYLNFYAKSGTLSEIPNIEMWFYKLNGSGEHDLQSVKLTAFGALSTDWKFYSIPLADFKLADKGVTLAVLTKLKISFDISAGTLYVDKFWFSDSSNESLTAGLRGALNTFNDTVVNKLTYPTVTDLDGTLVVSSVEGQTQSDKALRLDYNFGEKGGWLLCERGTGINAAMDKGFRFKYKGTGIASHVEFKLEDRNNVVFFKKFYNFTNTNGEWKTATVLNTDLTLFAKGKDNSETFDLKNIGKILFAVTKSGDGGSGTFYVDSIETISDKDFQLLRPGKIINSVNIDNNPFSPNNDGVKDYATFIYSLSDYAHVWLDIYNMAGEVVRRIDVGDQNPGSYSTLQWDGKDDGGGTVNNGLYFYRLRAKNPDNQSDNLNHIIMVLK